MRESDTIVPESNMVAPVEIPPINPATSSHRNCRQLPDDKPVKTSDVATTAPSECMLVPGLYRILASISGVFILEKMPTPGIE
jgi:hypothetical protein